MAEKKIQLPPPQLRGNVSVEAALQQRRSVRRYQSVSLTLAQAAQLLWAAQGQIQSIGRRTAPSAGALYPLEIYLVAGQVENLSIGVYKYLSQSHALVPVLDGDQREDLCAVALQQSAVCHAPLVLVICAVYERVTQKYGERGVRYVHMEAGHAAQNVYLQSVALDLATVVIGAFKDKAVQQVIHADQQEHPLYLMPVGKALF